MLERDTPVVPLKKDAVWAPLILSKEAKVTEQILPATIVSSLSSLSYSNKGLTVGSICAILSGVIKPNATIYIRTYELKESSIIP